METAQAQVHDMAMRGIIEEMQAGPKKCSKHYQCFESELETLCKVRHIGTFDEIECAAEDNRCCGLSEAHMGLRFCICPLRRYIARNFHK
jgi:hypothetical protein